MSYWCPWYEHTGIRVRHKRTGVVGEMVWRHPNGLDIEVQLPDGTLVCWFHENWEQAPERAKPV